MTHRDVRGRPSPSVTMEGFQRHHDGGVCRQGQVPEGHSEGIDESLETRFQVQVYLMLVLFRHPLSVPPSLVLNLLLFR